MSYLDAQKATDERLRALLDEMQSMKDAVHQPDVEMPLRETLYLTLVGFGAVNRALARLIAQEAPRLAEEHGLRVCYHAIIARHGCWVDPHSVLTPATVSTLADAVAEGRARLDGSTDPPAGIVAGKKPSMSDVRAIIAHAPVGSGGVSAVVEAIDVDYEAGEPAATYLRDALERGCHAVSANKGPVVHHRSSLLSLAAARGVRYLHESAVMDGVPIFSAWRAGFLPGGCRLQRFRGALNSTTSTILSGMEKGHSFTDALKTAQDAGIAEADPTGDTSGMDAAVKVVALAVALELNGKGAEAPPFSLADVDVSGIEHIKPEQVAAAVAEGKKLRLVGGAEVGEVGGEAAAGGGSGGGRARGYVRVEALEAGDVLYGLDGADAAVTFYTDRLAPVTILQQGSVVEDTAFGEYADLLRACRPLAV